MIGKLTRGVVCSLTGILVQPAYAQSTVTLYGLLDAGISYVNNQAGSSKVFFGDGINFGNRFGFRGREDLGGGNAAIFNLENGFSLGSGEFRQGGRMFGRQAWMGLATPYGTVTGGRQYDFVRDYIQQFNIGGYASVYAGHQGDFDRISGKQIDYSIKYASPNFSGFSFGAMYGFGQQRFDSSRGSAWSVGAGYKDGPVSVGAVYTRLDDVAIHPYLTSGLFSFLGRETAELDASRPTGVNDRFPITSRGVQLDKQTIAGIGASYRFANQFAVLANATATTFDDGERSSTQQVYEVGVSIPLASGTTGLLAYQFSKLEGTKWHQPTAGVRYDLSKRTWLYASASYLKATNGTHASQGAGFYLIPADGSTQVTGRVAMVHTF